MNARGRFCQSSIPNGHTACGPTKKTVVHGGGGGGGGERTNEWFIELGRLPMSNKEVCVWGGGGGEGRHKQS